MNLECRQTVDVMLMSEMSGCSEAADWAGEDSESEDEWSQSLCFEQPRHLEPQRNSDRGDHSWRVKEKHKTHCVALVLCLNVGVDPPDVVKTQPCARLQCWIDPLAVSPSKALETVGQALQAQYERWQPRARYKQALDPTADELKKLCCSLRRNAKDERVLFHYNGHGVPRPTPQGEIWVFNRSYTQYIPLSMYDLQTWMGAPSLYVYDCSSAGVIVDNFNIFAEQHEREAAAAAAATATAPNAGTGTATGEPAPAPPSYKHCIQLAACAAGQNLPMHPDLPADLFTACLTTPVKVAMRWFVSGVGTGRRRAAAPHLLELVDKVPGQVTDRRTMLGELNWIFTAITDTIAWSSLPSDLFQRLFRADLLTASLCRNFLLAQRVLASYNCTPVACPALPCLARHPLWAAWDHALDLALQQLPQLLQPACPTSVLYVPSPFFRDQLTAFAVWLELGGAGGARPPPLQLPMVLQVLLSTLHRVRALQILCRFLALGGRCVRHVLHVGIFPYMLKLLQASAPDLRPSMVYIWAKIIAIDPSCQVDLVNAKGHKYFLAILSDPTADTETRTLAAFVVARIVDGHRPGQEAALQGSCISLCLEAATAPDAGAELRVWAVSALGGLWRGYDAARWAGVRDLAHEKLFPLLRHHAPEVRAATAMALGAFISLSGCGSGSEHATALARQVGGELCTRLQPDCSALVRAELLAALQHLLLAFDHHFIALYLQDRPNRADSSGASTGGRGGGGGSVVTVECGQDALWRGAALRSAAALALPAVGSGSVWARLWAELALMAREPHAPTANAAKALLNWVQGQVAHVAAEGDPPRAGSLPPSPARADPCPPPKRPPLTSSFVWWAAAGVAREQPAGDTDPQCRQHHERVWRRARNHKLRNQAQALRVRGHSPRLETAAFHSRCALPPTALLFHPYDQHLCVASKDNFGVWDWGSGAKLAGGGWRRAWGRLCALEYLNAHERALLAAGAPNGNVAVFRASGDAQLLAAWRALPVPKAPTPRPPPPGQTISGLAQLVSDQFVSERETGGSGGGGGVANASNSETLCLAWCGARRSLAVAGAAPVVRLWDCSAELLAAELSTGAGTAANATSLSRAKDQHLLAAGFSDGALKLWDERASSAPQQTVTAHGAPVLLSALRMDRGVLLSACAAGELRVWDARALRTPAATARAPGPLAAAACHPRADLMAAGSTTHAVSLFDLRGSSVHTIRCHEGFMGARIGPVSSLAFHPLRAALAVGARDATVSVWTASATSSQPAPR